MSVAALPLVSQIAAQVHPDFFEDEAIFAERLTLAPQGCWMLADGEKALGYVLSHPWTLAAPPTLNALLGALPEHPDTFYIHDLALLPAARGTGAARKIVALLADIAGPYQTMSLVAVNGSVPVWSRLGFGIADRPDLAAKLATYDARAVFMMRPGS